MLVQVKLPFPVSFKIVRSTQESSSKVGWAIVFPEGKSILVDPIEELKDYCSEDELIEFRSDLCLKTPQVYKIGGVKVYHACYHRKPYLYIYEVGYENNSILFAMGLEDYGKVVKKLKPKIVLTRDGQILSQSEAYIMSVLNLNK